MVSPPTSGAGEEVLHKPVWQISYPYMMGSLNRLYVAVTLQRTMTTAFIKQTNKRAAMLQEEKVQCLAWILQKSLRILPDTCCVPSGFSGMSLAAILRAVCHIAWASWRRTQVLFSAASSPQLPFSSRFPGKKSVKAGLNFKSWTSNLESQQQHHHPDWKLHS